MRRHSNFQKIPSFGNLVSIIPALILAMALMIVVSPAHAQETGMSPGSLWNFFGDGVGDPYTSVFLNQLFGPLFPTAATANGAGSQSLLGNIIVYFNVIILLVGGLMFFYNITIGVLQSAHEGQVLGQRWSSLWAPLRLIFAVGLLVPVNEGYNLAQSGIAFLVQGSTKMASVTWSATASLVIDGDLPLTSPILSFDPDILATLYDQAACVTALNRQVNVANPAASVAYVSSMTSDGAQLHTSAIVEGDKVREQKICGRWQTPSAPEYLVNIAKAEETENAVKEANITAPKAQKILEKFTDGHNAIMSDTYNSLLALTEAHYDELATSDVPPASIGQELAAIHTQANEDLTSLVNNIRFMATSDDLGVSRTRDSLLARINGSEGCFEPDGSHSASTDRAAVVSCYGEGWMGAGSWYILMAKINNELSSLVSASSSATTPGYMGMLGDDTDGIYHAANGSGWWSRWFGGADTAGMPTREKTLDVLSKYQDLYQDSAIELAALGHSLPTDLVSSMSADTSGDANSFWQKIIGNNMQKVTRTVMDFFDPGSNGSDPMIGLISTGHVLIWFGSAIMGAVAASSFIGVGAAVALLPVYSILLSAGVSLAFILPIMPFLYWILGVLGYLLFVVQAVVGINLWALSHMRMDGEGLSGENGRHGWLMMLSLFMTPTLMVLGFIVGMIIFRLTSQLISAGLFYATSSIMGADPIIWLFGTVGYTVLIVTAYGLLLERSFSLVSEFPNQIMKLIGSTVEISGGEGRVAAAAGAAAIGTNKFGNGLEKGMGRAYAPDANGNPAGKGSGLAGKSYQYGERLLPWRGVGKGKK